MNISKKHLETLYLAVKGTEGVLSLAESRVRDAFMKPLTEKTQEWEQQRKAIYELYCLKNEDGSPDVSDGNFHFDPDVVPEVNKELLTLSDEEVDIEVPPKMKEIIEKTTYSPKMGEAEIIDAFLIKL